MNANEKYAYDIITSHYERGDFKRMISPFRLSPNNDSNEELKKDLEQDITLILYQYKRPDYLIELENKGCFNWFVMRIISNLVNYKKSSFRKKIINYEIMKDEIEDWREYSRVF